MKKSLIDILICPECKSRFNLEVFNEGVNDEVLDGLLTCFKNKHWYPIISGIPRIFVSGYRNIAYKQYSDYFNKYNINLSESRKASEEKYQPTHFEIKLKMTAKVFGFEWKKFFDYPLDNLNTLLHPYSLNAFRGKLGLDAGCGGGRHVVKCARAAATIIGVDLSEAVEEANRKSRALKNAHILQADIFKLPFKENTFDFIYSLGVLHHLPEPQRGFDCLADLLKVDGAIYIWVYKKSLRKVILKPIREITSKLPTKILFYMATILSFVGYFGIIVPCRTLIKTFRIFKKIIPSHILEYSKYNFKVYLTDWFDRLSAPIANYYSPEEIERWFKTKKLSDIQIRTIGDSWCYGYGRK